MQDLETTYAWPKEIWNVDFKNAFQKYLEVVDSQVFPVQENLLKAFDLSSFDKLKVVIVGQDPYHGVNQANGLAFSVNLGVKIPPSLRNIFKEVENCGFRVSPHMGDLSKWASQGVLLLNSSLSVQQSIAMSHKKIGWDKWTDYVIKYISDNKEGICFMLWGNFAQGKKNLIDQGKHKVLEASHPSPLSARHSFLGCRHFELANQYLEKHRGEVIDWGL